MESDFGTRRSRGQAIIELTLAIGLISAVLILSTRALLFVRMKFRHTEPVLAQNDPRFTIPKGLIVFQSENLKNNLRQLEEDRWKFEEGGMKWAILSRNGRKLFVVDRIGISMDGEMKNEKNN